MAPKSRRFSTVMLIAQIAMTDQLGRRIETVLVILATVIK